MAEIPRGWSIISRNQPDSEEGIGNPQDAFVLYQAQASGDADAWTESQIDRLFKELANFPFPLRVGDPAPLSIVQHNPHLRTLKTSVSPEKSA